MKLKRKALSVLLTLTMLVTLLLPVATPAGAVTKNTLNVVDSFPSDFEGYMTSLDITEDSNAANDFVAGKTFVFTLPSGVDFATLSGTTYTKVDNGRIDMSSGVNGKDFVHVLNGSGTTVTGSTYYTAKFSNSRTLNVTFGSEIDSVSGKTDVRINVVTKFDSPATGDLTAIIDSLGSGVTGGDFVIGRVGSGSLQATALSTETIGEGAAEEGGIIRLTENTPGAFKDGDEVKVKLPNDFKWAAGTTVSALGGFDQTPTLFTYGPGASDEYSLSDNGRELTIKIKDPAKTTTRGILEINPVINVDSDADFGDVVVNVSGDDVDDADLTIAKYADYGVAFSAKSTPEVVAGQSEVELGTIVLDENVATSLVPGRKLTIELPDYAKFAEAPSKTVVSGNDCLNNASTSGAINSDDTHKVEYVIATGHTDTSKIELKLKKINLSLDANGDIPVRIYGSAIGEEQSVVVGTAVAPVAVTTESKDVILGKTAQAAGDIIIKENVAGAINDADYDKTDATDRSGKELLIKLATTGVKFASTPTVEVTEGNLDIDKVTKESDGDTDNEIKITIKSASTKPSTIKISGVQLTVDRTVPVGGIEVKVQGQAIACTNSGDDDDATALFDSATVAKVYPAIVTNAAPAAGSAMFNVGSSIYYVDGVAKVSDAAPYVKNGRTYVPVRYLAYALGLSENDIAYAGGVVTLTKGSTVIKLTVGDKNIDNNGTLTAMDVAPEVVNGRTMLPARFVAEGFGAMVGFDKGQVVLSY